MCRFQGTADAVRQYAWMLRDVKNRAMEDIIILSGDHLYRMDYMKFIDYHRETGADITVGCLPCNEEQASAFGLMKIDKDANIVEFAEKPQGEALQAMKVWHEQHASFACNMV
jgi:glucose-1-phosphate adenylyltransferase